MEMKIKQTINWLRKEKNMREGHEPTDYIVLTNIKRSKGERNDNQ